MPTNLVTREQSRTATSFDAIGGVFITAFYVAAVLKVYAGHHDISAAVSTWWINGWTLVGLSFLAVLSHSASATVDRTSTKSPGWASALFFVSLGTFCVTFLVVVGTALYHLLFG